MRKRLFIAPTLLVMLMILAMLVGKVPLSLSELWQAFMGLWTNSEATDAEFVLWHIRWPRILAAICVGAALSVAGATYQGMFKNPLVSPDILGVSVGSGLGAVMAIFLEHSMAGIQIFAFMGGLLTVSLVYLISRWVRRLDPTLALVLSGIAVASLLGALISLFKLLADPYSQLTTMTFWMMGSLTMATLEDLAIIVPLILIGLIPLYLLRWRMNLLSLEDEEAKALGVNIIRLRIIFILAATLMTSAAVSMAGIIGWIGLVVPHITRLWIGPDFRQLLPTTLFLGAAFLLLTDTIARTLFPIEMPISIITAFVGAPFFMGLLIKGGQR